MSIINLINLQFGVKLTQDEWDAGKLSKERCAQLGVRSPKLSKALIALGMPAERVAMLLSGKSTKSDGVTQVWGEDHYTDALYDQGNSIHYSSCQATDSGAKWFQDSNHGPEYNEIAGDRKFWGESLFIWAVGQPMSWDGEGFKARAKLRVCYEKDSKEVAGLYIDRPYGQYNLLLDNISQLNHWWDTYSKERGYPITPLLMAPLWQRNDGGGSDFQSEYGGRYERLLWVPSYSSGYQDTLSGGHGGLYDFFIDVSSNTPLTVRTYKAREKVKGVRHHNVKEVMYNPQKGLTKLEVKLPDARKISRAAIKSWQWMWGNPSRPFAHRKASVASDGLKVCITNKIVYFSKNDDYPFFKIQKDEEGVIRREVNHDEGDFLAAIPLWTKDLKDLISDTVLACDAGKVFGKEVYEVYNGDVLEFYGHTQIGMFKHRALINFNGEQILRREIYIGDRDPDYELNNLTVLENIKEIGMARAVELPYRVKDGVLTVTRNYMGFAQACELKDVIDGDYIPF